MIYFLFLFFLGYFQIKGQSFDARQKERSRSLSLRTGRDSPQSFSGFSVMFLFLPNVKSTPFAGIFNKSRVLSFLFLNQGCCLRPKESVHVMKMSFELICCQPKGLVYRSSVCLDLAIVEPRLMTI